MAGESFQQLLSLGDSGKRTSVEGVGLNKDIEDAEATQRNKQRSDQVRRRENAIDVGINARLAQDKKDKEVWGTSDPKAIAAIKAAGVFDSDAGAQAQLDPVGFKERFDRVQALTGRGGVQDVPDAPPAEGADRIFYRENDKGTLEFTNQASHAPSDQGFRRYNSDSGDHKDLGAPGGDVGRIGAGGGGGNGAVADKPIEDIIFDGKLDQARVLAEKPDRQEAKAKAIQGTFDEIFKGSPDIRTARDKVQEILMSGGAKDRGLDIKDLKMIDANLTKRGKTSMELTKPGIDKLFFKPWVKGAARPGQGGDLAEPSSVVNPEGGTPETVKVQQGNMLATNEAASSLESAMPKEQPTMIKYAQGNASPKPMETPTPKNPTPQIGSHLASVAEVRNPVDDFIDQMTPAPSMSPEEALKRKKKDTTDPFGIGF